MNKDAASRGEIPGKIVGGEGHQRLTYFIPIAIFAVIAVAFAVGLTLNPREIPSALIGKPVPEFTLPPVQGTKLGLATENLQGEVSIVNVWASWCTECKREHPVLMGLAERNVVAVHGINYKDSPDAAQAWLEDLGDPYTRDGADRNGRVAIDWGVYGVPETFVVDSRGRIVYKRIGAMTEQLVAEKILPLVEELRRSDPEP